MGIGVFSFVAYSGTGKTTFLEKLIPELKSRGLRVAVYKHDAHEFEIDKKGKDSWRFTAAGADVTVISSGTKAAVMENRYVSPEELVGRIKDVDIIITEGYKAGPWPKIAMRRRESGNDFPIPPEECLAVITDEPAPGTKHSFGLEDISEVADFLTEQLRGLK